MNAKEAKRRALNDAAFQGPSEALKNFFVWPSTRRAFTYTFGGLKDEPKTPDLGVGGKN